MFLKKLYNYFWRLFDIFIDTCVSIGFKFIKTGRKFLLSLVSLQANYSPTTQERIFERFKKKINDNNEKRGTDAKPN